MSTRTRFRTTDGDTAPLGEWLRVPLCFTQWLRAKAGGRRPELPWIPYPAINYLARRIAPAARALEIGAGMSTFWLAARCADVFSIEANEDWFSFLQAEAARRGLSNLRLEYRWQADHMCDFRAIPDHSLDLVFVDGGPRLACIQAALPKLKAGGLLYVDNTDDAGSDHSTKRFLRENAAATGARLTFFRGLPPATLFINEGAVLEIARPAPTVLPIRG